MRKKRLRITQMTGAVVTHAQSLLDDLIKADWRGNGDLQPCIRRIARREGLAFSSLWALRYRPPKDVGATVLLKLAAAHEAMCDRQAARYRAARDATNTANPLAAALTRLATAIAGEGDLAKEG